MFDLNNMTNNLEGSSLSNVIIIAVTAFVLSSLIALVYQKTSREMETPRYFIQSLILISVPVATVIQAIGDSVARGLGMLGALAIIRFRTTLRNPRNMVFMFTSIAIGIAAGVYGITIAIVGTVAFCTIVFAIYASPLSKKVDTVAMLQFDLLLTDSSPQTKELINQVINLYCSQKSLIKHNIITKKNAEVPFTLTTYEYKLKVKVKDDTQDFLKELMSKTPVNNIKINFKDENDKI
ncbi:MAG: DUF4956 domain-containing protein [Nonlabens sp.]|uniref:DUF4956 domain-containing protein n=1 Tax=Nonlabens sp. TaxID=1888209 RepID=UPI003EF9C4F6